MVNGFIPVFSFWPSVKMVRFTIFWWGVGKRGHFTDPRNLNIWNLGQLKKSLFSESTASEPRKDEPGHSSRADLVSSDSHACSTLTGLLRAQAWSLLAEPCLLTVHCFAVHPESAML